jgi:hypothetical protein
LWRNRAEAEWASAFPGQEKQVGTLEKKDNRVDFPVDILNPEW